MKQIYKFYKWLLLLILLCSSAFSAQARSTDFEYKESFEEVIDGVHYLYRIYVRGILVRIDDSTEEYFASCTSSDTALLQLIWHEPGITVPEEITIPSKVKLNFPQYDLFNEVDVEFGYSMEFYPPEVPFELEYRNFNTVIISKDAIPLYGGLGFFPNKYIIEPGNKFDLRVEDGNVLMEYYKDQSSIILNFPWDYTFAPYYYTPSSVDEKIYQKEYFYESNLYYYPANLCRMQNLPIIRNEFVELNDPEVTTPPFPSKEDPKLYRKTLYPLPNDIHMSVVHPDKSGTIVFSLYHFLNKQEFYGCTVLENEYNSFEFTYLFWLYNTSNKSYLSNVFPNLKFVAFNTKIIPEIIEKPSQKEIDEIYEISEGLPKITTYVRPELIDKYRDLQAQKLFPANAVFKPLKDSIAFYPHLYNGKWVNRQSMFYFEFLRLGDAKIENFRWETSDESIATVDSNGIVTALQSGQFEVKCTITDTDGNEYAIAGTIEITVTDDNEVLQSDIQLDLREVTDNSSEIKNNTPKGVYNLHGFKIADSLDNINLPKGIYIVDGKKVAI